MRDSSRFFSILVPAIGVITGCVVDEPLPQLGPCAVYPDTKTWEYGQVGIGTCLAGPSDLQVRPDPADPDNHILWVVNSNSRSNFQGSSVLAIDASSIDLSCSAQGLDELSAAAVGVQEFAGRLDVDEDSGLGLLSSRQTAGADGSLQDVVYTLDLRDPRNPGFSPLGPHAFGPYRWLQVAADPWSVRINPADGRAWVLGLTTHQVQAIDLGTDPLSFVDLRGERRISRAVWEDVDHSGSASDWELLAYAPDLLRDEELVVTALEGTTRLFYPGVADDGRQALWIADAGDGRTFSPWLGPPVAEGDAGWSEGGLGAVSVLAADVGYEALAAGIDTTGLRSIGRLRATTDLLSWAVSSDPVLSPIPGTWDEAGLFDPDVLAVNGVRHVYWTGGDGMGRGIGHAEGEALTTVLRAGDEALAAPETGLVLLPDGGAWDSAAVMSPSVLRRGDTGRWLLYYAGHGGGFPFELPAGIGLAESDDGITWARTDRGLDGRSMVLDRGAPGSWDEQGIGAPSVFWDGSRFLMYYQGFDGSSWRTGRAFSWDGHRWEKDVANPLWEGVTDGQGHPQRAFALKVSPSGAWRVEGTLSGQVVQRAQSGVDYVNTSSPVQFRVTDGQALGRGPRGAQDEDGVIEPAGGGAGEPVLYVGISGSARRLLVGEDLGGPIARRGAVTFEGFAEPLGGLNGPDPTLFARTPDLLSWQGESWVAFSVGTGIAVASGDLTGPGDAALQAANPDLALAEGSLDEFDDAAVAAPSLIADPAGGLLLYYDAYDGQAHRIGLARSDDGVTWVKAGLVFDRGPAGAWDDASVSRPSAVWDPDRGEFILGYLGSDGSKTAWGFATSEDGVAWTRHLDSTGTSVPVWDGSGLAFGDGTIDGPRLRKSPDGYEMWVAAPRNGRWRIGRQRSADAEAWSPSPVVATAGDRFTMTTRRGDEDDSTAIELGDDRSHPRMVDGYALHGAGATELILSPDGHFAIVANKRAPVLIVLDLWDDSDGDWIDANAMDIECALRIPQRAGLAGVRDLSFSPDGTELWALVSPLVAPENPDENGRRGPEALVRIDWSLVTDEAEARFIGDDVVLSWVALPRGIEEDRSYVGDVSVGPAALALSKDGRRAYVPNYNDNSLSIVDLRAGARGAILTTVVGLDENPQEVALSPDGHLAYVANGYGQQRGGAQHSSIQVVDVDETSPTFGRILTRLSNLDRRADHGCP